MSIRDRLNITLLKARKARDSVTTDACRSALAAISNAEAPPITVLPAAGAIEAAVGLGAAEAARVDLSEDDLAEIVGREIAEREEQIEPYDQAGRSDAADKLRLEVAVLTRILDPNNPG